jgi:hypothetical protein
VLEQMKPRGPRRGLASRQLAKPCTNPKWPAYYGSAPPDRSTVTPGTPSFGFLRRLSILSICRRLSLPCRRNESGRLLTANATGTDERFDGNTRRVHRGRKLGYNAIKKKKGATAAVNAMLISKRVAHNNYDYSGAGEMLAETPDHREQEYRRHAR